jgi:hypothetical protein
LITQPRECRLKVSSRACSSEHQRGDNIRGVTVAGGAQLAPQELLELLDAEAGLSNQSPEGSRLELSMIGYRQGFGAARPGHDDVTATLPPDVETRALEHGYGFPA